MASEDASLRELFLRVGLLEARVRDGVTARLDAGATTDDPFRGLYLAEGELRRLLDDRGPPGSDTGQRQAPGDTVEGSRLSRLAAAFSLDTLDVDLLLVAVLPDFNPAFERLYGFLNDDLTRRRATIGLALEICGVAATVDARRRFQPGGPLIDGGLLVVTDSDRPFPTRGLCVPDRVGMHLLGSDDADPILRPLLATSPPWPSDEPVALSNMLREHGPLWYLREQPGTNGHSLAEAAFARLDAPVVSLDLSRLAVGDVEQIAVSACREARLLGGAVVAGPIEALRERGSAAVRVFTELPCPVVLTGAASWDPDWSRRVPLVAAVPAPSPAARALAWRDGLGCDDGLSFNPLTETGSFRLDLEQVARSARAARLHAALAGRPLEPEDLRAGARAQNSAGLERLATRLEPRARWEDLVLPAEVHAQLKELLGRARWAPLVLEQWGMARFTRSARGLAALFVGPAGTGKTLAAEALAHGLGFDLYTVDLARVVDKYIGETEKNLERIFTEAERVNGVLFFDEADALFGKRSEVRDAHDRYANVETAYLLQRIETFDGISILATNLRSNIDEAFGRRMDAIIDFPMPEEDDRRRLWARFFAGVPLDDDVDLDFCAKAFPLPGGNIRNIAVTAAFFAASAGPPVWMHDVVRAVKREYQKMGRLCVEEEFGPYFKALTATPEAESMVWPGLERQDPDIGRPLRPNILGDSGTADLVYT